MKLMLCIFGTKGSAIYEHIAVLQQSRVQHKYG